MLTSNISISKSSSRIEALPQEKSRPQGPDGAVVSGMLPQMPSLSRGRYNSGRKYPSLQLRVAPLSLMWTDPNTFLCKFLGSLSRTLILFMTVHGVGSGPTQSPVSLQTSQRAFRKHDIVLYAKAGFTIRNAVVSPRDHIDTNRQCGVIYGCACDVCSVLYVGGGRGDLQLRKQKNNVMQRLQREDSKSALSQHLEQSGHRWNNNPIMDKINVLDKQLRYLHRKVLEVVHIKLRGVTLNHNYGHFLLELYLPLLREDTRGGGSGRRRGHATDHCMHYLGLGDFTSLG